MKGRPYRSRTQLIRCLACYLLVVLVFHVSWNDVPSYLEQGSKLYGIGFHLMCNSACAFKRPV